MRIRPSSLLKNARKAFFNRLLDAIEVPGQMR
jgi:hypothetical protein